VEPEWDNLRVRCVLACGGRGMVEMNKRGVWCLKNEKERVVCAESGMVTGKRGHCKNGEQKLLHRMRGWRVSRGERAPIC